MSNFFDIPSLVRAKLREARLARTAAAAILFLPALCHAVDTGSTAYRSGKAAAYVVGGLLLFFLARRLLGGLAWARWLIVPAIAIALFRLHPFGGGAGSDDLDSDQVRKLAATVRADEVVMYSTTECVYCAQAKGWLAQNGFAFTECNMSASPACVQDFTRYGGTGTPYLVVRGHHMKDGFDSDQFLALLSP